MLYNEGIPRQAVINGQSGYNTLTIATINPDTYTANEIQQDIIQHMGEIKSP